MFTCGHGLVVGQVVGVVKVHEEQKRDYELVRRVPGREQSVPVHSDTQKDLGVYVLSDKEQSQVPKLPNRQQLLEGLSHTNLCPGRVPGNREEGSHHEEASV